MLAGTSEFLFPAESGEHPVAVQSRASDGDTPLHVLVWQNDLDGVRVLLAAGADVNAAGDMGYTPLHAAVAEANPSMVVLLLKAGARQDVPSELGGPASELARSSSPAVAILFPSP